MPTEPLYKLVGWNLRGELEVRYAANLDTAKKKCWSLVCNGCYVWAYVLDPSGEYIPMRLQANKK